MHHSSFLVSGTHSGVGKTTLSFILMSLFKRMGCEVQPFKLGPDFIDPGYHHLATGRESINLDFWMMGAEKIKEVSIILRKMQILELWRGWGLYSMVKTAL